MISILFVFDTIVLINLGYSFALWFWIGLTCLMLADWIVMVCLGCLLLRGGFAFGFVELV